ncbi:MAG: 2,3-bisphosphoglycerate-independent phosphoglycerate mutase [Alphaproteobacteria bacterium]|nr:2,3-bisphosphoglycerate-independent phosphoglycerate mutase [Alphaproteobacteria bacterium]
MTPKRPVLLCVLDGFGYREGGEDNAIEAAKPPVWNKIWKSCPHTLLEACGQDVGLPEGQMGNSEVGHMNIGAGRVIYQDLPLIDMAIRTGSLADNSHLLDFIEKLRAVDGACHLMGLLSSGGVHAHTRHILALAHILNTHKIPVFIHAFLDGRDVPPQSARQIVEVFLHAIKNLPFVKLATVCGRFYAMDRDKRWERIESAYKLLTQGEGTKTFHILDSIKASYNQGITDEFVKPLALKGYHGMRDGDGLLCANFRADRVREILEALLDPSFNGFKRERTVAFSAACGMTNYAPKLKKYMTSLFLTRVIKNDLGSVVAKAGLKQLRIAETEKYPHVTFFFNGGHEDVYEGETRILIPSPRVATYDQKPEMSAHAVAEKLCEAIHQKTFDLIIVNFANPDMVGHTGSFEAAVKAVKAVDECLGLILKALDDVGGCALITADHGNCEMMDDKSTQGPHTAHTLSKVPFVLVGQDKIKQLRSSGRLADIAPTVLALLNLPQPKEMTGESLLNAAP